VTKTQITGKKTKERQIMCQEKSLTDLRVAVEKADDDFYGIVGEDGSLKYALEELREAEKSLALAPGPLKAAKEGLKTAQEQLEIKQADLDDAVANGKATVQRTQRRDKAQAKVDAAQYTVDSVDELTAERDEKLTEARAELANAITEKATEDAAMAALVEAFNAKYPEPVEDEAAAEDTEAATEASSCDDSE